jgi:hypothetical protein
LIFRFLYVCVFLQKVYYFLFKTEYSLQGDKAFSFECTEFPSQELDYFLRFNSHEGESQNFEFQLLLVFCSRFSNFQHVLGYLEKLLYVGSAEPMPTQCLCKDLLAWRIDNIHPLGAIQPEKQQSHDFFLASFPLSLPQQEILLRSNLGRTYLLTN